MARSSLSITVTEALAVGILACALMAWAGAAEARPKVQVVEKTYTVNATTAAGLRQQMKLRGPGGYWAYTDWYVRWTGGCRVSVKINFTMPRHTNEAALDPALLRQWRAMVAALKAHEQLHADHGIKAAQEIERRRCAGGDAIIKKWADQDKVLDKRTNHGIRDGVVLK